MGSRKDIPTSFEECKKILEHTRYGEKKICNNTVLFLVTGIEDTDIAFLKLHNTSVVKFYKNGDIVLNTGRYYTVTTKSRINAALSNSRFRVWSKSVYIPISRRLGYDKRKSRPEWWIYDWKERKWSEPFFDGIRLSLKEN